MLVVDGRQARKVEYTNIYSQDNPDTHTTLDTRHIANTKENIRQKTRKMSNKDLSI